MPPPSQPATALVVGYDQRAGVGGFGAKDSRSDTLMLIRADPQQDTLSLLSFPRDLNVPDLLQPDFGHTVDRINAAWSDCGPTGTLDTVEKLTGIPINYLITLDFHGFKLIVNKLHGVYINVDHRYIIPPNTGVATINLRARVPEARRPGMRSTSCASARRTTTSTATRASSSSSKRSRIA